MGENSCHVRVGRLLEIRVTHGFPLLDDVEEQYQRLNEIFTSLPAKSQVVIAADWRHCPVMSPESATDIRRVFTAFNHRIERSAILGSNDSPTRVLQFFRVIREGGHPERKFFTDLESMLAFLDERLTLEESARARAFMGEA